MQPTGATRPPMSAGPWRRARCTASVLRVANHLPSFIRGESDTSFRHSRVLVRTLTPVVPPSDLLAPNNTPPTAAAGRELRLPPRFVWPRSSRNDLEVDDEPHPARCNRYALARRVAFSGDGGAGECH